MLILWTDIADFKFTRKQIEEIEKKTGVVCPKYIYQDDLNRHLGGLLLAKYGWIKLLGTDSPTIYYTDKGRPLFNIFPKKLDFSISHAGKIVVCALSSNEIGIDIENVKSFPPNIVDLYYKIGEREFVLNNYTYDLSALRLWTRKESYLKMTGQGLPAIKEIPELVSNGLLVDMIRDACFYEIDISKDYITTVCIKNSFEHMMVEKEEMRCLVKML